MLKVICSQPVDNNRRVCRGHYLRTFYSGPRFQQFDNEPEACWVNAVFNLFQYEHTRHIRLKKRRCQCSETKGSVRENGRCECSAIVMQRKHRLTQRAMQNYNVTQIPGRHSRKPRQVRDAASIGKDCLYQRREILAPFSELVDVTA